MAAYYCLPPESRFVVPATISSSIGGVRASSSRAGDHTLGWIPRRLAAILAQQQTVRVVLSPRLHLPSRHILDPGGMLPLNAWHVNPRLCRGSSKGVSLSVGVTVDEVKPCLPIGRNATSLRHVPRTANQHQRPYRCCLAVRGTWYI